MSTTLAAKPSAKTRTNLRVTVPRHHKPVRRAPLNDSDREQIVDDVLTVNRLIAVLQNAPGPISVEDQLILDELERIAKGLAAKVAAPKKF